MLSVDFAQAFNEAFALLCADGAVEGLSETVVLNNGSRIFWGGLPPGDGSFERLGEEEGLSISNEGGGVTLVALVGVLVGAALIGSNLGEFRPLTTPNDGFLGIDSGDELIACCMFFCLGMAGGDSNNFFQIPLHLKHGDRAQLRRH